MSISTLKGDVVPVKLWTNLDEVESQALDQLRQVAALPWAFHHIAVMPDVHYGKGATVGSVIAMKGALAPAAVGVDIGCGMGAIKTNLKASDLPTSLAGLRNAIEAAIPVGFNSHDKQRWDNNYGDIATTGRKLFSEFKDLSPYVQALDSKAQKQVGTLGGGNHFIELCLDEGGVCQGDPEDSKPYCFEGNNFDGTMCGNCDGNGNLEPSVWMMLHSGSRNIGKELAEIHIAVARKLIHNELLPDRDLAVFLSGTPEMEAYRRDLFWAQRYAFLNRQVMFSLYKDVMKTFFPQVKFEEAILCHHNYVSEETHFGEDVIVTRKGAISARLGELGIIPGSMGTKSYIVEGLGNEESFCSASHGAGRRMRILQVKQRESSVGKTPKYSMKSPEPTSRLSRSWPTKPTWSK